MSRWTRSITMLAASLMLAACGAVAQTPTAPASSPATPGALAQQRVPRPAHVVVVVMENKSYRQVMDPTVAPYIASLARGGALMTRSYALTHPSQPNYLLLFSGGTRGVRDDSCPHSFKARNLGSQLRHHGYSFEAYSEGLPSTGWTGCRSGAYARRHAPWVNFPNLPGNVSRPMTSFPTDYSRLPTLSFVIPNLDHDMHDGTIGQGDTWLRRNLSRYAAWARAHNSLLIVTFDEDNGSQHNRVPTIVYGAGVTPGKYRQHITHCSLLRTLESAYHLPALGCARKAQVLKPIRTRT